MQNLAIISNIYHVVRSMFFSSYLTKERILTYQKRQLCSLVHHAYKHVPYYRDLFNHSGIRPQDIRSVDDLQKIPITSKTDLQKLSLKERTADNINTNLLLNRTTSGSTGIPLNINRTFWEERLLQLFRLRALRYYGMKLTDKRVRISMEYLGNKKFWQNQIIKYSKLYPIVLVDTDLEPDQIIQKLELEQPNVIVGYPSTIDLLAGMLANSRISPRFICTGGNSLPPPSRSKITKGFSCPVYDLYGSNEFNLLAWECKKTGNYHINDDGVILEVLKNNLAVQPGETGEVVATNLHSFAMPIIRYRLGDIVTRGENCCKCGLPFSTIREIHGRTINYFKLSDGSIVAPFKLIKTETCVRLSWIRQYQIIQNRPDLITLKLVIFSSPPEQELNIIRTQVEQILGSAASFRIEIVDKIEPEKNGKIYLYKNLVKHID